MGVGRSQCDKTARHCITSHDQSPTSTYLVFSLFHYMTVKYQDLISKFDTCTPYVVVKEIATKTTNVKIKFGIYI